MMYTNPYMLPKKPSCIAKIFLEMRANNPAEKLYRKMGFEPIGRRKNYYRTENGEQLDAITFALSNQ